MMFTYLFGLFAVSSLFFTINCQYPPIFNSYRSIQTRQVDCTSQPDGWSCKNCTHLQFCTQGSTDFAISCGAQFPGRSYCNTQNKTCVATVEQCEDADNKFDCPAIGLFPHMEDCKKYISCPSTTGPATVFTCMYNSIFNSQENRCRTNSLCYTPSRDCANQYKIIPYRPNDSFYVICQGSESPILKYCGSNTMSFNTTSLTCDFKCRTEGNFPYPGNAKKFYMCVSDGRNLVKIERTCPDNTEFNSVFSTCVAK